MEECEAEPPEREDEEDEEDEAGADRATLNKRHSMTIGADVLFQGAAGFRKCSKKLCQFTAVTGTAFCNTHTVRRCWVTLSNPRRKRLECSA